MKLGSFTKLATVSALALGAVMYSEGSAWAIANGAPTTVVIDGSVINNFTITQTNMDFGTIGVHNFTGDVAKGVLLPTGTGLTLTQGAGATVPVQARLASVVANGAIPGKIAVQGLASALVTVHYSALTDMVNGGSKVVLYEIKDNLNALAGGDPGISGVQGLINAVPTVTDGNATTDATGFLTFRLGGTLKTDTTVTGSPPTGTYNGSVDITLSY